MEYILGLFIGIQCLGLHGMSLESKLGIQGPLGPRGLNGATGATGATGASGPEGRKGVKGVQGPQGLNGPTGAVGPVGFQKEGVIGPTGAEPSLAEMDINTIRVISLRTEDEVYGYPFAISVDNGKTFTEQLTSGFPGTPLDIVYFKGIYACVVHSLTLEDSGIYLSRDSITWVRQTVSNAPLNNTYFGPDLFNIYNGAAICVSPTGQFAAIGRRAVSGYQTIYRSKGPVDPLTFASTLQLEWELINSAPVIDSILYGMCYVDAAPQSALLSGYYIVGIRFVQYFSETDSTLTIKYEFNDVLELYDIQYSRQLDRLVIVCYAITPLPTVFYSSDSTTWTAGSGTLFQYFGASVAWNGSIFIACGAKLPVDGGVGPTIIWSSDGIVWQESLLDSSSVYSNLSMSAGWNGVHWVANGSDSSFNNPNNTFEKLVYSRDGKTWTVSEGAKILIYNIRHNSDLQFNAILTLGNTLLRQADVLAKLNF